MVADIILEAGQTGYDAVAEYVKRYWDRHCVETVIVGLCADDRCKNYIMTNVIASPTEDCDVEFMTDWWEGQQHIRLFGIMNIDEVNVTGGIYEE